MSLDDLYSYKEIGAELGLNNMQWTTVTSYSLRLRVLTVNAASPAVGDYQHTFGPLKGG